MHYEYFRKASCPSCGAGVVIDLSICPYCQRELGFIWKLEPEEEEALSNHVEALNHRLLSELQTLRWKIAYSIVSLFVQKDKKSNLDKQVFDSIIDTVRYFSYILLFLRNFFFFLPILCLYYFTLANIWGLLFISILSVYAAYLLTHFQIEKDTYSHKNIVEGAVTKILPETTSFLKKFGIGWTDFDQFIVSRHMKDKSDAHSVLASIVYIDGRK
jgi:hypothetical protein